MMFKRVLTLAGVAAAFAGSALAQGNWPDKPVTVIVPYAAGGNTDVAVSSKARYGLAPEYPAMADTAPGIDVTWAAIFMAPAGLPKPIAELAIISREPEVIEKLQKLTVTPVSLVGAELEAQIKTDFEVWKPIVESAKIPQPN